MCNGLIGAFEMLAQAVGPVFRSHPNYKSYEVGVYALL